MQHSKAVKSRAPYDDRNNAVMKDTIVRDGSDPSGIELVMDPITGSSTSVTSLTPGALQETAPLLSLLSAEIRQMIWKFALRAPNAIRPYQVAPRSNKFYPIVQALGPHMIAGYKKRDELYAPEHPAFTAMNLSLTCHQLYNEVAATTLLYKMNHFAFQTLDQMTTYLIAINPIRANSIRSIHIYWGFSSRREYEGAITVLATCEQLHYLTVTIPSESSWDYEFAVKKLRELKKLRGLTTFKISGAIRPSSDVVSFQKIRLWKLFNEIRTAVAQPREGQLVSFAKIKAIRDSTMLNIHGDGRIGPEIRPGMVSSRTRGQLKKQETLDAMGLEPLPPNRSPKYNNNGKLLWHMGGILRSRKASQDDAKAPIEVFVCWTNNGGVPTWELLDDIVEVDNLVHVYNHYFVNPFAYNVDIAIETIKHVVEKSPEKLHYLKLLSQLRPARNARARAGAHAIAELDGN